MITVQPFYIAGLEDPEEAKISAFGAMGVFLVTLVLSLLGIVYSSVVGSSKSDGAEPPPSLRKWKPKDTCSIQVMLSIMEPNIKMEWMKKRQVGNGRDCCKKKNTCGNVCVCLCSLLARLLRFSMIVCI